MSFMDVFRSNKELIKRVGEGNAYLAWVMALYLEEPDIDALASAALTDGSNDRAIDFIHFDEESKRLVFAQGFYAIKARDSAPASKAADLNTAVAWLMSGDLDLVPAKMKAIIETCRAALERGEIEAIDLLYVHNLPESINVARELQTVQAQLKRSIGNELVVVRALELGFPRVQQLFSAQESHIEVTEQIDFPAQTYIAESGPTWSAKVASVPGTWLHALYNKHGEKLYSANYRGFLGADRRRKVNSGIRDSAEHRPSDFWAFNNGITILTLATAEDKASGLIRLSGISIINGAQTSGSIGSLDISKTPLSEVKVLCRVIECSNQETIDLIVKYNNTQNAITTWDQFSNDVDQKRIDGEFEELGFNYNRKRGFVGVGDQVGIEQVIQPLLAFHGRPTDAIRGKGQLFQQKALYQNAFGEKKARHILFVYGLSRAVDNKRLELKEKSNSGTLIEVEARQLALLRNLNFKFFFISVVARTLETILGRPCDPMCAAFRPDVAKGGDVVGLAARWLPVVDTFMALVTVSVDPATFTKLMADEAYMSDLARQLNALLFASGAPAKHQDFAELVSDS